MSVLERAANKLKREIFRLPAVRVYRAYEHHEALEAHSMRLPGLSAAALPVLEGLRREGAYVTPVESLGLPGTDAMLRACATLADELRAPHARNGRERDERHQRNGRYALPAKNAPRLPGHRLMDFPEIYLWGLDERLLDLVENYVGLPVRYHGADIRREIADGQLNDVRQWHIDAEDWRMFKIILYLNDVLPGGGPFEYIPRAPTVEAARRLGYSSGFVTDDTMATFLPRHQWVECLAKAHSAVIADTCKVFHRAQPPRGSERYSVTFSWTSNVAVKSYPSTLMTDATHALVTTRLNARQRSCLPARRS
jgi:hypothetical protein